jgi:hypothetical protein
MRERNSQDCDPNRDAHGPGNRRYIEPVPQGTWLVIPYTEGDVGARPVANGDSFWESRCIRIRNLAGEYLDNAVPGQRARVSARIYNYGTLKAFPTRVHFAFVDAALGIPWSAPKVLGTVRTEVPPNQLGPGVCEVECPELWTPGDFSTRACLLVMCESNLTGDVPTVLWTPQSDRHVAQRNVTIISADQGTELSFPLDFTTILANASSAQIKVQAAWVNAINATEAMHFSQKGLANSITKLNRDRPANEYRMIARRTSRLFAQSRNVHGVLLEGDLLRQTISLQRVETIGRLEKGAFAPSSTLTLNDPDAFSDLSPRFNSKPLQMYRTTVTIRVPAYPRGTSHLLVRIAQFENQFVTGGYTFVVQNSKSE